MDQSFHPGRTREAGHARRYLDMHGIEGCAAALDVKASQKYLKFSDQPIWLSLSVG
jgi:hypothetical protein